MISPQWVLGLNAIGPVLAGELTTLNIREAL